MKTLLLSSVLLLAAACSGSDSSCDRAVQEPDFAMLPMQGSGLVDGGVPAPEAGSQYVISTTYLRMQSGDTAKTKFGQLTGPILAALPTTDGLVGYTFGSSDKCDTARTLLVWKDQTSMLRFVGSEAHTAAVAGVKDVSRGGSVVTHWQGTEADVSWDAAFTHLGAVIDGAEH